MAICRFLLAIQLFVTGFLFKLSFVNLGSRCIEPQLLRTVEVLNNWMIHCVCALVCGYGSMGYGSL